MTMSNREYTRYATRGRREEDVKIKSVGNGDARVKEPDAC